MAGVKDIICKVIPSSVANPFVKKNHYSGKVVTNSQLHIGAFLDGNLHGVMSFGPSMDKSKIIGLVKDTGWNDFIELNRMAFDAYLPKNSESRCIAQAIRMIRKNAPNIKWIISFADGTQCGDGTIYRASNFVLTGITPNKTILEFPDGTTYAALSLEADWNTPQVRSVCMKMNVPHRYRTRHEWVKLGAKFKEGYMLRYIYFIDQSARDRLTVPIIPFSKIQEIGAGMYKGQKIDKLKSLSINCAGSVSSGTSDIQPEGGGAVPTSAHHSNHRVRCNQCMAEFDEEDILVDYAEDKEHCPACGETDYLMDMGADQ